MAAAIMRGKGRAVSDGSYKHGHGTSGFVLHGDDRTKAIQGRNVIPGKKEGLNVELDKAIHLRDFILMGELIAHDALSREESCGGHFREEHQTEEGEAKRDDENFFYVGCWEYKGDDETAPELIKEPLEYEAIKVQTRNYKN